MKFPDQRVSYLNFFQGFQAPYLNLTWEVSCSNFVDRCRKAQVSSFQWLMFNLCRANLLVPAFRWRLDSKKKPVFIDSLRPSYTVLNLNDQFNFCTFDYQPDWKKFLEVSLSAKAAAEQSTRLLTDDPSRLDYIFITTIPWMRFTSIQHPVFDLGHVHIPSFAIGKFDIRGDVISFPFSVQAHHGFVDGIHLHQINEALIECLGQPIPC